MVKAAAAILTMANFLSTFDASLEISTFLYE